MPEEVHCNYNDDHLSVVTYNIAICTLGIIIVSTLSNDFR